MDDERQEAIARIEQERDKLIRRWGGAWFRGKADLLPEIDKEIAQLDEVLTELKATEEALNEAAQGE